MYIQHATYKSVPADSLELPVAAGTILTQNGTIPADLSQAFGIVPEPITNIPPTKKINVAVSGTIDLDKCGVSFTDEQIKALGRDFNFVPAVETPPAEDELPSYTSSTKNKFLKVNSSGNGLEWGTELPSYSSTEGTKYLYVNSSHTLSWKDCVYYWFADSTNDGTGETQLYTSESFTEANKVSSSLGNQVYYGAGEVWIYDMKDAVSGQYAYYRPIVQIECESPSCFKYVCMKADGSLHTYKTKNG